MKKNKIKDLLDISKIGLLILAIIFFNYAVISFILIVLVITLSIINKIFWRCKKCGQYLPNKNILNIVTYCPYCKADIDEKTNGSLQN